MENVPRLRDRLKQRTAEEIEEAAFALFVGHGYDETTVDQIAAAAGVSTRTFFRYFPSKEAVVFGDHQQAVRWLRLALAATDPALPPLARLQEAMLAGEQPGRDDERRRWQAELAATVPAVRAYHARLIEDFEDAIADALAPPQDEDPAARLEVRLLAGALFGALRAARRVHHEDPSFSEGELFAAVFALFEHDKPAPAGGSPSKASGS